MATPSTYKVQKGDTLWALGQRYGVDHNNLQSWNRISDPTKLQVGQTLRFSAQPTQQQQAPAPAPAAPAPAPKPQATPLQQVINNAKQNAQNLQNQYQNSQNTQTANGMINATIDDIAKKYGFDFSREYAARQAETEAQAKRNAFNSSKRQNQSLNQETMSQLDAAITEGNQALDHSFFQNYLQQRQQQANSGMNAGIAAEQDLRLGMNQQSQLAAMYRDANQARNQERNRFSNESQRLQEALGLVEQERLAKEDALFQQLRQQAFDTLAQERSQGLQIDSNEWKKIQDRIAREFDMSELEANKIIKESEFSGNYGGNKTAAQLQREFERRMEEAQMKLQQDRFAWEKQQAAAELALARSRARGGGGGGGGGGSTTGGTKDGKSMNDLYAEFQKQTTGEPKLLPDLRRSIPPRRAATSPNRVTSGTTASGVPKQKLYELYGR